MKNLKFRYYFKCAVYIGISYFLKYSIPAILQVIIRMFNCKIKVEYLKIEAKRIFEIFDMFLIPYILYLLKYLVVSFVLSTDDSFFSVLFLFF